MYQGKPDIPLKLGLYFANKILTSFSSYITFASSGQVLSAVLTL